jgi:hypothetical protein
MQHQSNFPVILVTNVDVKLCIVCYGSHVRYYMHTCNNCSLQSIAEV